MNFADYIEFGNFLIETEDLDPLYVILLEVDIPDDMMLRWLLAYWIFYSAGVASRVAEEPSSKFFDTLRWGNENKWPRGHERRHMRGKQFNACVSELELWGKPEAIAEAMLTGNDFQTVSKNAQKFRGFGPWIAWKIADMSERVLGNPVSFNNAEIGVYADPVKGAALIGFGDQKYPISLQEVHDVFADMQGVFGHYKAPATYERHVNIQELETIACKYKSHINNHYPAGNDVFDIYEGLHNRGDLAEELKHRLYPLASNILVNHKVERKGFEL